MASHLGSGESKVEGETEDSRSRECREQGGSEVFQITTLQVKGIKKEVLPLLGWC